MFPTNFFQDSDGEKSDQDLVVDIANETVSVKHKHFELTQKDPNEFELI